MTKLTKQLRCTRPVVLVLAVFLVACSTSAHKQYYLLTPVAAPATDIAVNSEPGHLIINIGPVTLPEYLDRSQIVTRRSDTELDLSDSHRWAEPLQENFTRVLVEDLQARLGTDKVTTLPVREYTEINYRVTVDVARFDASEQGEVLLIAAWSLYDGKRTRLLESRRTEYRMIINSTAGYPETVEALSQTIDQLSNDIYQTINSLDQSEN